MQKAALTILVAQLVHQRCGKASLGGAQCVSVPFSRVAVGGGHEGRLTTHGQANIAPHQLAVYRFAQSHDAGPLVVGVGLGDARGFVNPGHAHVVGKSHFALVNAAFYRRCA